MTMTIYGSKLSVSIEFSGGKVKHLVMNWQTFDARVSLTHYVPLCHTQWRISSQWLEDRDITFLDEDHLLGISKRAGVCLLTLYSISKMTTFTILREFELPEAWVHSLVSFCLNTSAPSDFSASSDAMFYNAPETRIIALTAQGPNNAPLNMLFVKEAYFKFPSRKDPLQVPWKNWGRYCLVKEIPGTTATIRGPRVVGTKVLYIDAFPSTMRASSGKNHARLHLIDFSPLSEAGDSTRGWTSIGPRAGLVPFETSRSIPSSTVGSLVIDEMRVTEDNIVMFMVSVKLNLFMINSNFWVSRRNDRATDLLTS